MLISMIAAMTEDSVIGSKEGFIPWDLPRDREHFRSYTAGKWMLVGRKTYEEMDGWFSTQTPVVVTRQADYSPTPGHHVAGSIPDAIELARTSGAAELVVCGGAEVYAAALPYANKLLITRIDGKISVEHPSYFPKFESSGQWRQQLREIWPSDSENLHAMTFEIWDKQVLAGQ